MQLTPSAAEKKTLCVHISSHQKCTFYYFLLVKDPPEIILQLTSLTFLHNDQNLPQRIKKEENGRKCLKITYEAANWPLLKSVG